MSQSTAITPTARRQTREALGVSRAAVQKVTGLAGSVIWRSEQEGKEVTEEQRNQLDELYAAWQANGVPAEYAKPEKPKASEGKTGVHPATRVRELTARLNEVAVVLTEAADAKTLKETKAAIERAREVISPPVVIAVEPATQPATEAPGTEAA